MLENKLSEIEAVGTGKRLSFKEKYEFKNGVRGHSSKTSDQKRTFLMDGPQRGVPKRTTAKKVANRSY